MSRRGFLTGGTCCVDRNLLVDTWPGENGRADVLEDFLCGGGSSYNLGSNIKALDPEMPVATVGLVGDDDNGTAYLEQGAANGIDMSRVQRTRAAKTDFILCFASEDTGRRTHISAFGAADHLTPEHFDFSGSDHRLFHLGLPGVHAIMDAPWGEDANGWVAVLKKARAAGLQTNMELVSIPPERQREIIRPCLPQLDLLVVNDEEIGGIASMATVVEGRTDPTACLAAARDALAAGTMEIVAVHYPDGALALTRTGELVTRPAVNVPAEVVKGANGAGDAFAAGFTYAWHEGWPLDEMLRLAHATAAASLRDITTTGAVEDWRTCLELANGWGWRDDAAVAAALS